MRMLILTYLCLASHKSEMTNILDPDQTPQNAESDKGPHCLHYVQEFLSVCLFVCIEVLRPSQPNGVMSSAVSLPNHTFTGQA